MDYVSRTSRFHVAVRLVSNISQNVVRTKKGAHKEIAVCVPDVLTAF